MTVLAVVTVVAVLAVVTICGGRGDRGDRPQLRYGLTSRPVRALGRQNTIKK